MNNGKLGTVCIITSGKKVDNKGEVSYPADKQYSFGTITKKSMSTLTPSQQYAKLVSKVKQNLQALSKQIQYIAMLPEQLRCFRISSTILPLFDEPEYGLLYDQPLKDLISNSLSRTKSIIDHFGIRVGMHPDKFCVINSDNPTVRTNSIRNLSYHHYVLSQLQSWQDGANINIHLTGKLDHLPQDVLDGIAPFKEYLSFENDDVIPRAGLLPTLSFCEKYGIRMLLDVHHYFAETVGVHFDFNEQRDTFQRILNTWQPNVLPLFHVSQSASVEGLTPKALSSHSDMIDCPVVIGLVKELLCHGDVEVEAKAKNISVKSLHHLLTQ
jgi:UV DNA damage endonuclease